MQAGNSRPHTPFKQSSARQARTNTCYQQDVSCTRQPKAEEDGHHTNSSSHHNDLHAELKSLRRCSIQSRSGLLYKALPQEVQPQQQPRGARSIRFKFYAHRSIRSGDVGITDKELHQPASSDPEQMTWDQVLHALLLCYPPCHSRHQQHVPSRGGISATGHDDDDFLNLFITVLQSVPFAAFFFETTPLLGAKGLHQPFECVLIDAGDTFSRRGVSSQLFDEHLASGRDTTNVKCFLNLGKDALLVAPCLAKEAKKSAYGTLATFVREAPIKQVQELWRVVAERVLKEVSECPSTKLWVNTDGRAVPWLHLRIDTAPKYIKHQPYRYPNERTIEASSPLANRSMNDSAIHEQRSPATNIVPSYNHVPGRINHAHGKQSYGQRSTHGGYSVGQGRHATAGRSRSHVNGYGYSKQYSLRHSDDDLYEYGGEDGSRLLLGGPRNGSQKQRSVNSDRLPAECDAENGRDLERSEGSSSRNINTVVARVDEFDCGIDRQASHCAALTISKSSFCGSYVD